MDRDWTYIFNTNSTIIASTLKTYNNKKITLITTNNVGNLKINDYITFNMITKYGNLKYKDNKKFKITQINYKQKRFSIKENISINTQLRRKYYYNFY